MRTTKLMLLSAGAVLAFLIGCGQRSSELQLRLQAQDPSPAPANPQAAAGDNQCPPPPEKPPEPGPEPEDPGDTPPPDPGPEPPDPGADPGPPGPEPPNPGGRPNESDNSDCDPATRNPWTRGQKADLADWKKKSDAHNKWKKDKEKKDDYDKAKKAKDDWNKAKKERDDYDDAKEAHDAWTEAKEKWDEYLTAKAEWDAAQQKKKGNTESELKVEGADDSAVNHDGDNLRTGRDETITINSAVLNPAGVIGAGSDATFLERLVDLGAAIDWYPGNTYIYNFGLAGPDHFVGSPGTYREITRLRDSFGNIIGYSLADAVGGETEFSAAGQITSRTDRDGNTETYTYVGNQVVSKTAPNGRTVMLFGYYPSGRLHTITDVAGNVREFCYDVNAHLLDYIEPATDEYPTGGVWSFQFSSGFGNPTLNGNLLKIADPDGNDVVAFTYDANDRAITESRGGATWTYAYSVVGIDKITTVTDPRGATTVLTYSGPVVEPTKIEEFTNLNIRPGEPPSYVSRFAYDANFNPTLRVTPEGRRFEWKYDAFGNITETRVKEFDIPGNSPSDKVRCYTWGLNRQMLTSKDEAGDVIHYTWTNGRLVRIDYPQTVHHGTVQNPFETYAYNAFGQKTEYVDREGIEHRWTYFPSGPEVDRVATMARGPVGSADTMSWTYNTFGRVATYTGPMGNQVVNTYNGNNQLKEFAGAGLGAPRTKFIYNGRGRVRFFEREYLDEIGASVGANPWIVREVRFNTGNRVTQILDEISTTETQVRSFSYDAAGNLAQETRADGTVLDYVHDERNLLYTATVAPGTGVAGTTTWNYSGDRSVTEHIAENGAMTTFEYDRCNRLVVMTDALGNRSELQYDVSDNITTATMRDAALNKVRETIYLYDAANRRVEERKQLLGTALEAVTQYHYTAGNRIKRVVDPTSVAQEFSYDAKGRVALATLHGGRETHHYTYDAGGRLIEQLTDLHNDVSSATETYRRTYTYDAAGRTLESRNWNRLVPSQSRVRSWSYDSFGRDVVATDTMGETTRRVWDAGGPLREVIRDVRNTSGQIIGGRSVKFTYLNCALLKDVTDDNGKKTVYTYDARARVVTEQHPDLSTRTLTYAFSTLPAVVTDQNGSITTNTYDVLGRLTNVSINRGPGVVGTTAETMTYDAVGRRTSVVNDFATVEWTWDALDCLVAEKTGANPLGGTALTTTATYDLAGRLTGLGYPGGTTVGHYYGPAGEVQSSSRNATNVATYQSLGMNLAAGRQNANGTSTTISRDGYRRVVGLNHLSGATSIANFSYGYRVDDALTHVQRNHLGGTGDVFGYDRDRGVVKTLRGVVNPPAEVATPGSQPYTTRLDYALDGVVNRSQVTATPYLGTAVTTAYTTTSMNQYSAVGGVTRAYDANGNLTDDGTYQFKYDYRDRLVEVVNKSTQVAAVSYSHDAVGRRYQKTVGSSVSRFVSWGNDTVEERGAAGLTREFVQNPRSGGVVGMWTAAGAGHWFHADRGQSTSKVTSAAGAVLEEYRYNEFGGHTIHNGAGTVIATSAIGNTVRFQGQRYDSQGPGLHDFKARAYDATTGRFLQHDPAGPVDNVNRYSAMDHNALLFRDRDGRRIAFAAGSTPAFRRRTNRALSRLRRTREGQRLYNEIRRSRDTVTFEESNRGNRYRPRSNTVFFDPCATQGGEDIFGNHGRPSFVGLGHEMRHALDDISGVRMVRPNRASLGNAETNATASENLIRDQAGVPRRRFYQLRDGTRHPVHNNPPR